MITTNFKLCLNELIDQLVDNGNTRKPDVTTIHSFNACKNFIQVRRISVSTTTLSAMQLEPLILNAPTELSL